MLRRLRQPALGIFIFAAALSASATAREPLVDVDAPGAEAAGDPSDRLIRPTVARYLRLDAGALAAILAILPDERSAPNGLEGVHLTIPFPDGSTRRYRLIDSPILEPALAARFPEIRTFRLIDVDDRRYTGRGDVTMAGFHAAVRSPEGMLYVDPVYQGNAELHQSYFRRDLPPPAEGQFRCEFENGERAAQPPTIDWVVPEGGLDLRTYRTVVAATVEYTAFHGGTIPLAMAAITTAMNRVNEVYEHDVAIRMILVANNDAVVYTAEPDPYSNNNGFAMLGQNTTNLNNVIGTANYDIGHVFSTGGGGVASLAGPCGTDKARGVTGLPSPIGDPFYIDYVAHEMGHQWGANHSFNGSAGACAGGNRNAATAYEPGSGSTIMSYAGICGAQDLQGNSDPYFHRVSLNEIQSFSRTGSGDTCALTLSTQNQLPVVDAGPAYVIPLSTPFALEGSATDGDGDTLSFLWEEWDLGPAGPPSAPSGNAPIFRSFNPVTAPVRTFPKLSDLLANTATIGEILPTYARTLNFRLTAFDNFVPAGGNGFDGTTVTVDGGSGPFLVTSPNTALTWSGSGPHLVTWNVANTTAPPVSCSHVDLILSTDGGITFDDVRAAGVLNNGATSIWVGVADTEEARLQVACAGNIFFDISNVDFSIVGAGFLIFADGFESDDTDLWSDVQP